MKVEIDNLYGPTETTIDATCGRYKRGESEGAVQIGGPICNMRAYVLDESGDLAPEGVVGELYLGGAGLGRGYQGKPELTAERFLPDDLNRRPGERLYRTGDRVLYNEEGQLEYLGRGDQQIKLRGHRIELGEIEAVLRSQSGVAAAAVALKQGARGEGRLVGYVVKEESAELRVEYLLEGLLRQLPDYMAPASFVVLEQMPLLPNGKIDRRRLPEPELMKKGRGQERILTPVEQILTDLWEEALGLREIGIDDNFFVLGGDSILSIQVVARANRAGLRLTPKQVFDHQTIRKLAAVADSGAPVFDRQLIEERDYWLERLAERNGTADLVPEHKRREGRDMARGELEVEIGAELCGKLRKLSGESDFLLYAVLAAGLKVCLNNSGPLVFSVSKEKNKYPVPRSIFLPKI